MQHVTYMNGFGEERLAPVLATFVYAGATYYVVPNRIGAPTLIDEACVLITHS